MKPTRDEILSRVQRLRISAILRTDDIDRARSAMRAAIAGGFSMVEFTLTTPGALELIAEFARDDQLLVGAGTVISVNDVDAAVENGAKFIVSPIYDVEVIRRAASHGVVSIPGTFTPTEMMSAIRAGADVVKLFPAPANVAEYVSAILGPLPHLRIFPTAGVTPENFVDILKVGAFGVGFVKSLFAPDDLSAGNYSAIERRASEIQRRLVAVG